MKYAKGIINGNIYLQAGINPWTLFIKNSIKLAYI